MSLVRLFTIVLALIVATPSVAIAQASHWCGMGAKRTFSCCCAKKKSKVKKGCPDHAKVQVSHKAKRSAAFERGKCCKSAEPLQASPLAVTFHSSLELPLLAVVSETPSYLDLAELHARDVSGIARARAPPALGPPLFIKNCTLLN